MKGVIGLIGCVLLLVVAIVLGAQNDQQVTVNYLIAQSQLPLSSLMAIVLLMGVILSGVIYLFAYFRLSFRIRQLKKQVAQLSRNSSH